MAPDRAYRASERGSSQFYDARRVQLPAWKPAGVGWCMGDSPPWIFAPKKNRQEETTPNSVFDKELIHFWIFSVVCFGFFGCLVWLRLVWPRLVWSGLIVCLFIYLFLVPVPLRRPAFKCTGTLLDGNHFLPYTLQVVHPPKFSSKLPRPKR